VVGTDQIDHTSYLQLSGWGSVPGASGLELWRQRVSLRIYTVEYGGLMEAGLFNISGRLPAAAGG